MTSDVADPTASDLGHPQRWWILVVLCLALTVIVLDNTILSVALPRLAHDLDASESTLQWVTTAYSLVLAGLLLPLAGIGDRYGRKRLLLIGLVVFGLSSIAAAWAATSGQLVAARALMGVGGACSMPATLAILSNVFPPAERGRAIALWSGVSGLAGAAGPVVGGLLLNHFWWGSVFLVNVPVVLVTVVGVCVLVPPSKDPAARPIDVGGSALWTGALVLVLYGIIEGPVHGWTSPIVLGTIAAGVALVATFAAWERRAADPLLPPAVVAQPRMQAGMLIIPTTFFAVFGVQFVLTQWLQGVRGLDPLSAGLCFIPQSLAIVAASAWSPHLAERRGERSTVSLGFVLLASGLVGIAAFVPGGHVAAIVVVSVAFGAGIGFTTPIGVELQMGSVPPERAGIAAGVNETIVEAGGALGVAVLGSVLAIGVHGSVGLGDLTGSAGAAARDDFAAAVPLPLLVAAGVVVALAAVVRWRLAPTDRSERATVDAAAGD